MTVSPISTSDAAPATREAAGPTWPSRVRLWLPWLVVSMPVLASIATDFARRGARITEFEGLYLQTYLGSVVESLVVWGILVFAAAGGRRVLREVSAVLFIVFFTFAFGGQSYFYEQYRAYLNVDVSLFASNFMDSVVNQLFADFGNYAAAKLPWLVAAVGLVWLARRVWRPGPRTSLASGIFAPLVLVAAFFVPTQHRHVQASTPDALYLHAVGGLIRTQLGLTDQSNQLRPRVRQSLPVPPLRSSKPSPPNVLLLVLESVRADATCIEYDPGCRETEYSNRLTPERLPLRQMRSLASCTAISLAVLWSGLEPTAGRKKLHEWPLLFDYANAAGWDTAFWTSQNMMFGNARLWVKNLGVNHFVSATELDPTCDLDMGAPERYLASHFEAAFDELREPFFATVQFSNVHYPYYMEIDAPQPFQPWTVSKDPDVNHHFFNFYKNAVHQEDRHVAAIIRKLRSTEKGKRTIIVYTSDHGEAFREHGQMGHTFSVLEEEIHVPAWIDAPAGTLSDEQRANVRAKRDVPTFHVDITATILDLMGLWHDPAIEEYRASMVGQSLLEPEPNSRALPLTNCAGVWSCAFENWGYMRGKMKLEARSWDDDWHCYDVLDDPYENRDLGIDACGDLQGLALERFGRLPGRDASNP